MYKSFHEFSNIITVEKRLNKSKDNFRKDKYKYGLI